MIDKNILSDDSNNSHKNQKLTFDAQSGELKWVDNPKDSHISTDYFKEDGFF